MKVLMVNDYQAYAGAETHLQVLIAELSRLGIDVATHYAGDVDLQEDIVEWQPDILHVHNWSTWADQRRQLFGARIPTVLSLHDYLTICSPNRMRLQANRSCPTPCGYKCGGRGIPIPEGVTKVTFNEASARIFQAHGLDCQVISHGIALERWPLGQGPRRGLGFVCANAEAWWKGLGTARRIARKLGVPLRIITGGATAVEVSELLQDVEALLYPGIYAETFGLVIAEAMASGAVVIAYDVSGGQRSLVRDGTTGCLVSPGDETAMLVKARQVLGQDNAGIRTRARRFIEENHSSGRMARDWLKLYREMLQIPLP